MEKDRGITIIGCAGAGRIAHTQMELMNQLSSIDEPIIVEKATESVKSVYDGFHKHILEKLNSDIRLLYDEIIEETKFMTTRFQRPEQVNKKRNKNRKRNKQARKQRKRNKK